MFVASRIGFGAGSGNCSGLLPQPLTAVPAFLFVDAVQPALPYALGFAAGAMVFMVLVELLPEAFEQGQRRQVGLLVSATLIAMVVLQQFL